VEKIYQVVVKRVAEKTVNNVFKIRSCFKNV